MGSAHHIGQGVPARHEIWSLLVHSIRIGTVAAIATWRSFPLAARMSGDCGTVEDLKIEDTNLPEYCRVLGYARPAISLRAAATPCSPSQ